MHWDYGSTSVVLHVQFDGAGVAGRTRQIVMKESAALNSSIDAAIKFLRDSQDDQGRWMDFHLYPGISDEWVTGYAGYAASAIPNKQCDVMARSAWKFLKRRQRDDG